MHVQDVHVPFQLDFFDASVSISCVGSARCFEAPSEFPDAFDVRVSNLVLTEQALKFVACRYICVYVCMYVHIYIYMRESVCV